MKQARRIAAERDTEWRGPGTAFKITVRNNSGSENFVRILDRELPRLMKMLEDCETELAEGTNG